MPIAPMPTVAEFGVHRGSRLSAQLNRRLMKQAFRFHDFLCGGRAHLGSLSNHFRI